MYYRLFDDIHIYFKYKQETKCTRYMYNNVHRIEPNLSEKKVSLFNAIRTSAN